MLYSMSPLDDSLFLQNWWYTTLLNTETDFCVPLQGRITCDVVIIGGGMAGLHAAQRLAEHGRSVIVLERNICGGGSTGKSAGFLTPDSELELHQLVRRYGSERAMKVWSMATIGIDRIVANVQTYDLACDLLPQESLFLGIGQSGKSAVYAEAKVRESVGYPSTLHESLALQRLHPGRGYTAAVSYGGTYGINPLLYAQELKEKLLALGVRIFEGTAVTKILGHTVHTHMGEVEAAHIILCADKIHSDLSTIADHVYHAQTFLSVSEPLEDAEIAELFPQGNFLCWDSKLVYSYYRLTGDRRLLLGGGTALTTFLPMDVTPPRVILGVIADFKKRFPFLKHHAFTQYWPGRIDTTKDLVPIVDFDPSKRHIQYVLGCVGLPWATFCGDYAAQRILDPSERSFDAFLRIDRGFLIPAFLQKLFGKMIVFSLNNIYSKYIQKGS